VSKEKIGIFRTVGNKSREGGGAWWSSLGGGRKKKGGALPAATRKKKGEKRLFKYSRRQGIGKGRELAHGLSSEKEKEKKEETSIP